MNDDGKIDRDDLLQYMRLISRFDSVAVTEEKQEEYLNYAVDSTLNECGNGIFITLEDFQVRTPTKQRGCNFQLTWNIFKYHFSFLEIHVWL